MLLFAVQCLLLCGVVADCAWLCISRCSLLLVLVLLVDCCGCLLSFVAVCYVFGGVRCC